MVVDEKVARNRSEGRFSDVPLIVVAYRPRDTTRHLLLGDVYESKATTKAGLYLLTPVTVAVDAVTLPLQAVVAIAFIVSFDC
jgi:hypothetical protein